MSSDVMEEDTAKGTRRLTYPYPRFHQLLYSPSLPNSPFHQLPPSISPAALSPELALQFLAPSPASVLAVVHARARAQ